MRNYQEANDIAHAIVLNGLDGITRYQHDEPPGWWENSAGVSLGAGKQAALINALRADLMQDGCSVNRLQQTCRDVLKGVDEVESDDGNGWWEEPSQAEAGAQALSAVLEACATHFQ